jgi:elongation of very long chain fatty acids protein 6
MSTGFIFANVNALVHTFMYWYYYKATIGEKPTWGMALTLLQISQMFVGLFVNGYYFYLYMNVRDILSIT